jgi:hypothetical protein
MKKLGLIAMLLAASVTVFADGNTATVTTSGASLTVVAPINVSRVADLSFGSLVVDPTSFSPGAVTVGKDNLLNFTSLGRGTWRFTGSGHPTASAAQFLVTGEEGYAYGFAALDFTLLHTSGDKLKVSPLVTMVDTVTHGTIPATVAVGGTLFLDGKPQPGLWSGTFSVTAIYL